MLKFRADSVGPGWRFLASLGDAHDAGLWTIYVEKQRSVALVSSPSLNWGLLVSSCDFQHIILPPVLPLCHLCPFVELSREGSVRKGGLENKWR